MARTSALGLTVAVVVAIVGCNMRDQPARHAIVIPAKAKAAHLAVLLHGVGADADSFSDIARALAPACPGVEFVIPDGFHPFDGGPTGRQWFSIRGVTEANRYARVRDAGFEVSAWIDEELKHRGLDKLILIGFSQGSIVSAWLAVNRSPRPEAVVMMSGRAALEAPASTGSVPVFIGHGDRDGVIPVAEALQAQQTLEGFGAVVTAKIYPGLAHGVDARELQDVTAFLKASCSP